MKKILYVEDQEDLHDFLLEALDGKYSVDVAVNIDGAKTLLKDNLYDIIILDMSLKGKQRGEDLFEFINKFQKKIEQEIYIVSARQPQLPEKDLERVTLYSKPHGFFELIDRLQKESE